MKILPEILSPYCQESSKDLNLGSAPIPKFVTNLQDNTNYVVHYRNLYQYLELGMEFTNIDRVRDSPWHESHFNTKKRKRAANDVDKVFFKLMNKSVFGKIMENLRKRVIEKLSIVWFISNLFWSSGCSE